MLQNCLKIKKTNEQTTTTTTTATTTTDKYGLCFILKINNFKFIFSLITESQHLLF